MAMMGLEAVRALAALQRQRSLTPLGHYPTKKTAPRASNAATEHPRRKLEDWERAGRSPTQRTLAYMRAQGYECDLVERALGPRLKRDLFNAFDIFCIGTRPGLGLVLVQTTGDTTGSNFQKRVRKVSDCPQLPHLLANGIRCITHGWAKRKPRGVKKPIWILREHEQ